MKKLAWIYFSFFTLLFFVFNFYENVNKNNSVAKTNHFKKQRKIASLRGEPGGEIYKEKFSDLIISKKRSAFKSSMPTKFIDENHVALKTKGVYRVEKLFQEKGRLLKLVEIYKNEEGKKKVISRYKEVPGEFIVKLEEERNLLEFLDHVKKLNLKIRVISFKDKKLVLKFKPSKKIAENKEKKIKLLKELNIKKKDSLPNYIISLNRNELNSKSL